MGHNIAAIGRTDKSRFKHHFFASLLYMLRVPDKCRTHEHSLLVDLTAGDGDGVRLVLRPSFISSPSTAVSMARIATQSRSTDVHLYEKDSAAFDRLRECFSVFPRVRVMHDNRDAYLHVNGYNYLSAVIDYNGANEFVGKYGVHKHLKRFCREAPDDFDLIILFNEQAIPGLIADTKSDDETQQKAGLTRQKWYSPTLDPNYFVRELDMPHLARSVEVFEATGRYGFRAMVLSRQPLGDLVGRWNAACRLREQAGGCRPSSNGFHEWWNDTDFPESKRLEVIR